MENKISNGLKILVTGGAGFIGSNLVEYLLSQGHAVTVVDNLITGQAENVERFSRNANYKFFDCGIETAEFRRLFSKAKRPFDRIYNLACPTGVPNIQLLGDEILAACSAGTSNVLDLANRMKAKFLLTSSSEIYGQPEVFPQSESYSGNVNPLSDRANYEEGKRFSETLVQRYAKTRRTQAKIVRLFNVYGPYMHFNDTRVIPRFARQALSGDEVTVQGDGRQRRTLCYVTEIIAGLELVMENGVPGKAYNLGSDEEITMIDLAKLMIEMTGSASKILFVARPDHDHDSRRPALDKIHALGWRDGVSLKDGISQTLSYYRSYMDKEKNVKNILERHYLIRNSIKARVNSFIRSFLT